MLRYQMVKLSLKHPGTSRKGPDGITGKVSQCDAFLPDKIDDVDPQDIRDCIHLTDAWIKAPMVRVQYDGTNPFYRTGAEDIDVRVTRSDDDEIWSEFHIKLTEPVPLPTTGDAVQDREIAINWILSKLCNDLQEFIFQQLVW